MNIEVELSKEECEMILSRYVKERLKLPITSATLVAGGCRLRIESGEPESVVRPIDMTINMAGFLGQSEQRESRHHQLDR